MGETVNIRELYSEYGSMVYTLALSYLKNIEEAEEITQDVFLKAHHKIDEFKQQSSFKTWVYRITINCCLDHIKAKNRDKRKFQKNDKELKEGMIQTFYHPGLQLENKELGQLLFQEISALPENQKTAFILSKEKGLSLDEISIIMERSTSSVESLLFRAKQNLKERLSKRWEEFRK
ncbi:MAG: RNA polymerase sigma factor [Flavobacteriales bacterium]|nr:RNA polymerase sigma factor [Flavobacteriales bacterium]